MLCSVCGGWGAMYVDAVDEHGNPAGDRYHPFCLGKQRCEESNKREAVSFSRVERIKAAGRVSVFSIRGINGNEPPNYPRTTMFKMRNWLGRGYQHVSKSL